MVHDFYKMGVVEVREGIADDPDFPPFIFVESRPEFPVEEISQRRNLVMLHVPAAQGGATPGMLAEAAMTSGRADEEVVAGYHDEVHRFVRRPYTLVPTHTLAPDKE
jgi:hypothetical protein